MVALLTRQGGLWFFDDRMDPKSQGKARGHTEPCFGCFKQVDPGYCVKADSMIPPILAYTFEPHSTRAELGTHTKKDFSGNPRPCHDVEHYPTTEASQSKIARSVQFPALSLPGIDRRHGHLEQRLYLGAGTKPIMSVCVCARVVREEWSWQL